MKTPAYQRVFQKLNEIRNKNPDIANSYLVRPTSNPDLFEFIAEADTNYYQPRYVKYSIFEHPPSEESTETVWPGEVYDDSPYQVFSKALRVPGYGYTSQDKWGSEVTGMAPIIVDGVRIAILCEEIEL